MMGETQTLNVSHAGFSEFTSDSFKLLFGEEDFRDVCLVTDDDTQIQAHRVVLALCSPVLQQQLKGANDSRIQITDVSPQILSFILEFMYLGETKVPPADVVDFFANRNKISTEGPFFKR